MAKAKKAKKKVGEWERTELYSHPFGINVVPYGGQGTYMYANLNYTVVEKRITPDGTEWRTRHVLGDPLYYDQASDAAKLAMKMVNEAMEILQKECKELDKAANL